MIPLSSPARGVPIKGHLRETHRRGGRISHEPEFPPSNTTSPGRRGDTQLGAERPVPGRACAPSFSGPGKPRAPTLATPDGAAPPGSGAKDTVAAPERRARQGGARRTRHLETTATRGVAPGPPRPGHQAQSPLAARRRGPPPLAPPALARGEAPGRGEAGSRRCELRPRPGSRERAPGGTAAARVARATHPLLAEPSGAENYNSRHAVSPTAAELRRGRARQPAGRPSAAAPVTVAGAARGVGTRAMEETPPPLQAGSKPHLEKLTLGITRILGEWTRKRTMAGKGRGRRAGVGCAAGSWT